jgi:hypothetical protein
MIRKIQNLTCLAPLILGLACSAGASDDASNHDASRDVTARSSELKSSELAPAVATTAVLPAKKAIALNPAGQISMGGSSSIGGVPGMGGMTGLGGVTGANGGANANGGSGANGGTSSSCCDKCDGECSPKNWVCAESTCTCDCVGGDEPIFETHGL